MRGDSFITTNVQEQAAGFFHAVVTMHAVARDRHSGRPLRYPRPVRARPPTRPPACEASLAVCQSAHASQPPTHPRATPASHMPASQPAGRPATPTRVLRHTAHAVHGHRGREELLCQDLRSRGDVLACSLRGCTPWYALDPVYTIAGLLCTSAAHNAVQPSPCRRAARTRTGARHAEQPAACPASRLARNKRQQTLNVNRA